MKFLGQENTNIDYKKSRVVVIPVPYEKTTSYGKGAQKGPRAILNASNYLEDYDIEEDKLVTEIGISTMPELRGIKNPKNLFSAIASVTGRVLEDDKLPVYLGGEHTITAAVIYAFKKKYDDFTILHLDAHSDIRDKYKGSKYSHACVMRRIFEMGVPFVSVGVRSQCFQERQFIKKEGVKLFYAHQILNNTAWIQDLIKLLGKRFYLTFDTDVMDPSCLRATGTPEPGGFMWPEVSSLFKVISKADRQMIGMDMVELAPVKYDHASDFLCAKIICKLLALFIR